MNKYLRMDVGVPVDEGYAKVVGYGVTPEGREFSVTMPTYNYAVYRPELIEPQVREVIENWVPGWRPIL